MKALLKSVICSVLFLGAVSSSWGAFGFFGNSGSFLVLNFGGADQYFELGPSSSPNPTFAGDRLNRYHPDGGPLPLRHGFDKLVLNGFENNTFENGTDNILTGNLSYRVYRAGDTPGDFRTIAHNAFTDLGSGNERHENTTAGVDILGGIVDGGIWVLEAFVWADADYGDGGPLDDIVWAGPAGNIFQSSPGSAPVGVFTATFNVERLPEPSTVGLLGVGVVLLRVVRKKKPLDA